MICFVCQREFKRSKILINSDGDCACGKKCAEKYKKDEQIFMSKLANNPKLMEKWLKGKFELEDLEK